MLALLAPLLLAASPASRPIDAPELKGHIRYLASDLLEGRGPASRGDALAQAYIAAQFESLGLEPAGVDGGFLQPVELVGVDGHPETLTMNAGGAPVPFKFHDEFIVVSGHQQPTAALDKAELVFVGYGIRAPEHQWDDFKGMDLTGKVLVVMNNDPEDDPALFGGKARLWYGRWDYKYEQARLLGAAGCLIIHTTPSAGYPWQVVQTSWTGEQFDLPAQQGHTLQVKGWLSEDATRKLFALKGHALDTLRAAAQTRAFRPVPLGVTISTKFTNRVVRKASANVLAMLRGADPLLREQVVVLTAHHDHLGIKADAKPGEDAISNGAVDNASGVAAMLAIARALATMPKAPKRSVLFAAVAAEARRRARRATP